MVQKLTKFIELRAAFLIHNWMQHGCCDIACVACFTAAMHQPACLHADSKQVKTKAPRHAVLISSPCHRTKPPHPNRIHEPHQNITWFSLPPLFMFMCIRPRQADEERRGLDMLLPPIAQSVARHQPLIGFRLTENWKPLELKIQTILEGCLAYNLYLRVLHITTTFSDSHLL